jgi:hypothetical protein
MVHPITKFEKRFYWVAGVEMMMNEFKKNSGHQSIRGMDNAKTLTCCE